MRNFYLLIIVFCSIISNAQETNVGKKAPTFYIDGIDGKKHTITEFIGKIVVLEWINFDCSFVKKHYLSKQMQTLQKKYTAKNVIWIAICSSPIGEQGNLSNEEIQKKIKNYDAHYTAYLKDVNGKVGKSYGATVTPQMFIIDKNGIIVYNGAIDSINSSKMDDISIAKNYIDENLTLLLKGEKISMPENKPYGCIIKYF